MERKLVELKKELDSLNSKIPIVEFQIGELNGILLELEETREKTLKEIEKIENSKEYKDWKENRVVILPPGQISLVEVIEQAN